MAVTLHKAGERAASALIRTGKYDMDSAWSFSAEDGDKLLGGSGTDWANYGKWHLGEDGAEADDTKEHWKYPYGKDGQVYRRAVAAIRSRAKQNGATAVFDAAGRLMTAMDGAEEKAGRKPEPLAEDDPDEEGETVDQGDDDEEDEDDAKRAAIAEAEARAIEAADLAPRPSEMRMRLGGVRMEHASLDPKSRTIDTVVSSGAAVRRFDYNRGREYDEVLTIDPAAIRLDRLNRGAAFLDSHNHWGGIRAMIGAVVPGSARIENGELCARCMFSATPEGERAFTMAQEGTLRHVSVGYMTHAEDIDESADPPIYRATDWEPYEVSAVAMPADPRAAFRSVAPLPQPATRGNDMAAEVAAARETAVREERERTQAIRDLGVRLKLPAEFVESHITEGSTIEKVREAALDKLAQPPTDNARMIGSPAPIGRHPTRQLTKAQELGRLLRIFGAAKGEPHMAERIARSPEMDDGNTEWQVRALTAGIGASGGFLVPEEYYPVVIELLRNRAVIRRLGAMTIPMVGGNLTMPRLQSGATAAYVGEANATNASQEAFGQVRFTEKKLMALVPVSNDLLKFASPQADEVVLTDMIAQIAVAEDLAFIRGAGTQYAPKGMRNWAPAANVLTSAGTTLANFITDLLAMESALEGNNVRMINPAIILNPRSKNAIKLLQTTTGAFVFRDEMANGTLDSYKFDASNNIPKNLGSGAQTEWYLVDLADAVIADVPGLEIEISREAAYVDSTGTMQAAFSQDVTVLRAIERHDFAMRHDVSVAVMTAVSY